MDTLQIVAAAKVRPLSSVRPEIGTVLDDVLGAALMKDPEQRFSSARAFATALESEARRAGLVATHAEVGTFVRRLTLDTLEKRRALIRDRAKELDALLPSGTTTQGEGELRAAIDKAQIVVEERARSIPDAGALTPQPEGTLSGTGKTGRTTKPRQRARLWLVAFAIGAALAFVAFVVVRSSPTKQTPRSAGGAATGAASASSATSEPLTVSSGAPLAPLDTVGGSASTSSHPASPSASSSSPPSSPPRPQGTPRQPGASDVPPNPYGKGTPARL